jgi:hypothetical protein
MIGEVHRFELALALGTIALEAVLGDFIALGLEVRRARGSR